MSKTIIRVPQTTVTLILALAKGLREVLRIEPYNHEHWEFINYVKEPEGFNEEYYGKGSVAEGTTGNRLELRSHLEIFDMSLGGDTRSYWVVHLWAKQRDNPTIRAVGYVYWAQDGKIELGGKHYVPEQPHDRIKF